MLVESIILREVGNDGCVYEHEFSGPDPSIDIILGFLTGRINFFDNNGQLLNGEQTLDIVYYGLFAQGVNFKLGVGSWYK